MELNVHGVIVNMTLPPITFFAGDQLLVEPFDFDQLSSELHEFRLVGTDDVQISGNILDLKFEVLVPELIGDL